MKNQTQVLKQLQVLKTISKQGVYSDSFVSSLRKIIIDEIEITQRQIEEIEVDLQNFEQQYNLSSENFHQQFKKGQLGDQIDFVEWNAFYQMWSSLQERLKILQSPI